MRLAIVYDSKDSDIPYSYVEFDKNTFKAVLLEQMSLVNNLDRDIRQAGNESATITNRFISFEIIQVN